MAKNSEQAFSGNPYVNRRRIITAFGSAGLTLFAGSVFALSPKKDANKKIGYTKIYPTVSDLVQDKSLDEGMLVQTAGYFALGDGGGVMYEIRKDPDKTVAESNILLANNLYATLVPNGFINYQMFGAKADGQNDDSVQIKAAHAYANHRRLPVINLSGEYWLQNPNKIEIKTNVQWGQTIFHVNEQFNSKSVTRFSIESSKPSVNITLSAEDKKKLLAQLKPGVQVIPELAPYKNSLVIIADKNDRIGYRAGAKFTGQSWDREELFLVEEHGRILGDIAWVFKDYTKLIAYPADETYLTIEGGTFFMSGDSPGRNYDGYRNNGFNISRSRTIIRNQWVGLEPGKADVAMDPRRGFYAFTNVYDITLENVRLIPWEQDRQDNTKDVPAGTYGISAARILNGTFRNVTAEGGPIHWGVFGTNLNKNFRIENCRLNRVDVHFHCWNLHIKDSNIGYRGISVTGGGDLKIENTTCASRSFINFRRDFGAKWDGNIYIRNCRFIPPVPTDVTFLDFNPMNFDHKYPVGFGRIIKVEDVTVDYSLFPDAVGACWLMKVPPFSKTKTGERLFFPHTVSFKNISVTGRALGVRLLEIYNPETYNIGKAGQYNQSQVEANAKLTFENIHLESLEKVTVNTKKPAHFRISQAGNGKYEDAQALYPEIRFVDCNNLVADLGGSIADLILERCQISALHGNEKGKMPGSMSFQNCSFQPRAKLNTTNFYSLHTELGTSFTNCTIYAPVIDGNAKPELVNEYNFVQINKAVRFNHLNTKLGNEIIQYYKNKGQSFAPKFISWLKNHHELESEIV